MSRAGQGSGEADAQWSEGVESKRARREGRGGERQYGFCCRSGEGKRFKAHEPGDERSALRQSSGKKSGYL